MNDSTKDLHRSLKTTAGSRFSAAKRVAHLDSRLTAVTALTSVYIVVMTILPNLVTMGPAAGEWVNLFTIALSILLLVVSLLHYACQFGVKAELFHRSALEIQELKRELQFLGAEVSRDQFNDISGRYNDIMKRFALNHDDADFWRYQLEYPQDFPLGIRESFSKWASVKFAYHYPSFILAVITLMAFVVVWAAVDWSL